MDWKHIYYKTLGGVRKNLHFPYYVHGFSMLCLPRWLTMRQRGSVLQEFERLPLQEQEAIQRRVDYYCRLKGFTPIPADSSTLGEQRYRTKRCASVYFFDSYEWNRYFPAHLHWSFAPGDVNYLLPHPSITKSRPIADSETNQNSVLINMDKVRHFMFFRDPISTHAKENRVIFRGAVHGKPLRAKFFEQFFGNPMFDLYDTSTNSVYSEEKWQHRETCIYDHLSYKYIMCLEGNDVASNLKWVMNSNSLAISPAMKFETWFMEGRLIPNYHYIEVKPDFSDIEERVAYYNVHPDEAAAIVQHAHDYCRQFFDARRERLISLMVMDKYFRMTGQEDALNEHVKVTL